MPLLWQHHKSYSWEEFVSIDQFLFNPEWDIEEVITLSLNSFLAQWCTCIVPSLILKKFQRLFRSRKKLIFYKHTVYTTEWQTCCQRQNHMYIVLWCQNFKRKESHFTFMILNAKYFIFGCNAYLTMVTSPELIPDTRFLSDSITLVTGLLWTVNVWNSWGPLPTVSGCWTITLTVPELVP